VSNLDFPTACFLMLCGHALADFALQNDWTVTNKNRNIRDSLSPEAQGKMQVIWPHLMTAHSLHHGLMVFLVTQKLSLGLAETVVHWVTDFGKCEKWFGFHTDQVLHIAAKIVWALALTQQWV
jgi:hypothetical protein